MLRFLNNFGFVRRAEAVRELYSLSHRELRDLGLSPSDVPSIARQIRKGR